MSFQFSEQHLHDFHAQGYTVLRAVIPPSLIADLRREADRGRTQARERHGPQAQRFQPVAAYDLDCRPFADFRDLPELRAAVSTLLSPEHTYGNAELMGVLVEPAEQPYCTRWHRDWRDNAPHLDLAAWEAVFADLRCLNQVNCALYEDHSLWVVPGSHLRQDLPRERALFPSRPIPEPEPGGTTPEERERAAAVYCRSMPGAVRLHLEAGDFALYRNSLWHLGSYVPYARRATLHDFVDTPFFRSWRERVRADMARRQAAGVPPWAWAAG